MSGPTERRMIAPASQAFAVRGWVLDQRELRRIARVERCRHASHCHTDPPATSYALCLRWRARRPRLPAMPTPPPPRHRSLSRALLVETPLVGLVLGHMTARPNRAVPHM